MTLIQVLLPLYSNSGRRFSSKVFAQTRAELVKKFGGLTAYSSVAKGFWRTASKTARDDIVLFEVMAGRADKRWWGTYRRSLETRFAQDSIVVRALLFRKM